MGKTKHYYRTVAENKNIKVEFDSESEDITINIDVLTGRGDRITTDTLTVHKSYIEPLIKLMREVIEPPQGGKQ